MHEQSQLWVIQLRAQELLCEWPMSVNTGCIVTGVDVVVMAHGPGPALMQPGRVRETRLGQKIRAPTLRSHESTRNIFKGAAVPLLGAGPPSVLCKPSHLLPP